MQQAMSKAINDVNQPALFTIARANAGAITPNLVLSSRPEGDMSYTTTRYDSFASTAPIPLLPCALGNIRFGLNHGLYSTSLFVNNVTDRRAMLAVQNYSGVHDGEPYYRLRYNVNVPRTIGLAFPRRFLK
jgi:hypothetical protein